jgi:hypothetical protein
MPGRPLCSELALLTSMIPGLPKENRIGWIETALVQGTSDDGKEVTAVAE